MDWRSLAAARAAPGRGHGLSPRAAQGAGGPHFEPSASVRKPLPPPRSLPPASVTVTASRSPSHQGPSGQQRRWEIKYIRLERAEK